MPLDLKQPGNKEYVIFAGGALGLGLLYILLHKKTATAAPVTPAGATGATGASASPSRLPGGQSPTGNALTDSVAQSTGAVSTAVGAVAQAVLTPVRHAPQGAGGSTGTGIGGGGSGGGGSGGTSAGGSASASFAGTTPLAWASEVLKVGGFPNTKANLQSLVAWALLEGGGGANNPLNTTQPATGATTFNGVGVKNYPSQAVGVNATVATLNNGLYSNIVAGLKSGLGIGSNAGSELSKWSGGGYSSLSGTYARAGTLIVAPKVTVSPGTKAASASQIAGLFPTVKATKAPVLKAPAKAKGVPRLAVVSRSVGNLVLAFQRSFKAPPRAPSRAAATARAQNRRGIRAV